MFAPVTDILLGVIPYSVSRNIIADKAMIFIINVIATSEVLIASKNLDVLEFDRPEIENIVIANTIINKPLNIIKKFRSVYGLFPWYKMASKYETTVVKNKGENTLAINVANLLSRPNTESYM